MSERCCDCKKTGVPLVGLGGAGIGAVRKRCIPCFEAAMKAGAERVRAALLAAGEEVP